MVDILVAVTFSALHDKYSIEGHEEWITELDSSTEVWYCYDSLNRMLHGELQL